MRIGCTHAALFTLLLTYGGTILAYEEPDFSVVATVNHVEFRRYEPYLVAETTVVGETDRDRAVNTGFRRLFNYISGDNILRTEVTTTEGAARGTKISMTVPVQQIRQANGWTVSFVVPSEFEWESVPLPADSQVRIRQVPGVLIAALRYSGRWNDRNVERHEAELIGRLNALDIVRKGPAVTAFYNAPFSLPFMRRNEVMFVVDRIPADAP
ncbi:MAG: heme-binding protein [Pseudomonadales bacterium]|nr:heme-binding protein [Pseudomonadales bacterium]